MLGKNKCRILKEIRQRIADENGIPYEIRECTHQGNCSGTCPRCESEVRYLEDQLKKRASLGKRVTVAALCAGMALTVSGCDVVEEVRSRLSPTPTPEIMWLDGEVPNEMSGAVDEPEPTSVPEEKDAVTPVPTEGPEEITVELQGDVPYIETSGMVP